MHSTNSTIEHPTFDVLIVGSGLMGAAVAHLLRQADAHLRIGMVDGGTPLGSTPGRHLHDVPEPEIWGRYNERVSTGIQGFYTGVAPSADVGGNLADATPGMYHLQSIGEDAAAMPAAAVAWNVGGMGVHWTAATPTPWGSEVFPQIDESQWRADLHRATELLRVNRLPYPPTPAGQAVTKTLGTLFDPVSAEGRGIQPMPMAVNPTASGLKERTGPTTIFPPIGNPACDDQFTLYTDTLATSVVHRNGRATGVTVRDVHTGDTRALTASQVIVCADAIRTPQLLFASGIRPHALGRFLNEHIFLSGQVLADPGRLGFDLATLDPPTDHEWAADCIWIPHSDGDQPFQVHVMNAVMIDHDRSPLAYAVGLEFYVATEIREENALRFSDTDTDAAGMPRITIDFGYTDADRASLNQAQRVQRQAAELLGPFDPATESAILPAGSSLHFTGTVRMGAADDGTSVCDTDCRVWGFENLFVAGCGVIPTALKCNSTLTGMTTAVRAARAVSIGARR
ncbi:GMC oxidoreductase [Mycolicibacterium sp. 050158]|uniref:GMC oxidoreductase n=1 Tax=Mycolicibacterium sp. 050158 TaxID=3090602 RepID=UPI00299ECE31|nr:GMC oxidoreductase [Mycolicibacterium sp. 050158]MDX1891693.1 GMC oxidoreductase [Mycolicibacterium sp. 050158]